MSKFERRLRGCCDSSLELYRVNRGFILCNESTRSILTLVYTVERPSIRHSRIKKSKINNVRDLERAGIGAYLGGRRTSHSLSRANKDLKIAYSSNISRITRIIALVIRPKRSRYRAPFQLENENQVRCVAMRDVVRVVRVVRDERRVLPWHFQESAPFTRFTIRGLAPRSEGTQRRRSEARGQRPRALRAPRLEKRRSVAVAKAASKVTRERN